MNNSNKSSEHVRPMLEAMARSIDAARAKRTATPANEWSGPSEGAASLESVISTSSTQPQEHPVSALLGDEMLVKLRSAYEELDQQLQSAQLTEPSKNELVSRVQSLNPDSWLAGEEVILRIEKFDSEVAAIQGLLSNA